VRRDRVYVVQHRENRRDMQVVDQVVRAREVARDREVVVHEAGPAEQLDVLVACWDTNKRNFISKVRRGNRQPHAHLYEHCGSNTSRVVVLQTYNATTFCR